MRRVTSFVKYVLFFCNLIVALFGLAVVGIGVAMLVYRDVIQQKLLNFGHLSFAPRVFIVFGAIMFIIAFIGCLGAIRESHCMVVTYAIFLLVIIIVQVVLAVLMFTYADTIQDAITRSVNNIFDNSRNSQSDSERKAATAVFNSIEQQLECCGKDGPTDYGFGYGEFAVYLPASCCTRKSNIGGLLNYSCTIVDSNKEGCASRTAQIYRQWNKTIAGVAIGVACVEVVGALFALCLANSIRNMDRRSRY